MSSSLEKSMNDFEKHGPYTWDKLWNLVQRCAKNGDWQMGDTIDECLHKFPLNLVEKVLLAEQQLNARDLKIWRNGTYKWKFRYIFPGLSDEACELVARHANWNKVAPTIDFEKLPSDLRTRMVMAWRDSMRFERDRSPTRD